MDNNNFNKDRELSEEEFEKLLDELEGKTEDEGNEDEDNSTREDEEN